MILRGLMLALVLPALLGLGARASYAKPFRQTSTIEVFRPGSKARPGVSKTWGSLLALGGLIGLADA